MNKRRFGRISLLVTATLAVLVAVQVWSLVNMYHARREEFSRQVMQAMTRAAYDDLLLGNKPSGHKSHISFSSSGNIDSIHVDMIQEITVKNLDGAGKSITFTPKSDTIHHDISISDGPETRFIRQEIRIPSVYVLRLNMARYDSLLTCNLQTAGSTCPTRSMSCAAGATVPRRQRSSRQNRRRIRRWCLPRSMTRCGSRIR